MDQQKMKIAYHETGHAIMALRYSQKIQKVSLKGMNSPGGADSYSGFLRLESDDQGIQFTGEMAIQKIMISLSGYATEILFYDGHVKIGGDDLKIAVKLTEDLLPVDTFREWVAGLKVPSQSVFDVVENTLVRAYLLFKLDECIQTLNQVKPAIQLIAEELHRKDELTGDEVSALFNSFMQTRMALEKG